jgi:transcriptional regulator with XRE-family HTH domain
MPIDFSSMEAAAPSGPATKMMAAGLERLRIEEGLTQREVAVQLGYKTSVVVSHMASGRVPIPIERAAEIAGILKLDPQRFLLAALEQRFPTANIRDLFGVQLVSHGRVGSRLALLAGGDLDDLPPDTVAVIDEVVTSANPRRRWLSIEELALVELLRRSFPELMKRSLRPDELAALENSMGPLACSEEDSDKGAECTSMQNPHYGTS